MINIILISVFIFYICTLILDFGYKQAIKTWKPEEMLNTIQKINEQNKELLKQNTDFALIENNNRIWYLNQLKMIGNYLKEKHNDNYIFDNFEQLNDKTVKNITYDIDVILDKMSKYGFDSLTDDEKEYLKNVK